MALRQSACSWVDKTACCVSVGKIWRKKFSWERFIRFIHRFYTLRENCSTFWQNFFDKVVTKRQFPCPQNHFAKKKFLWNKPFFIILAKLTEFLLSKFSGGVFESWILRVRWTLLTKKIFYQKNFTIFSHGAKTCLLFVEIVPTGLTKLHCRWPKEHFQNSFFWKSH